MKRNRFGVNLDEGIPLIEKEDIDILYVDCFGEIEKKLTTWLKDGKDSLFLGGQIGSGKSTLINNLTKNSQIKPDIVLHLDYESLNLDIGDFLSITLIEFINFALNHEVDLSFCNLPEEIGDYKKSDWKSFVNGLNPRDFLLTSTERKRKLLGKISENRDHITNIIKEIGNRICQSIKRPLFIFASGIDKYDTTSSSFFDLKNIISLLSEFKTLFEMNAVHLFFLNGFGVKDRLLINAIDIKNIREILSKRMGGYAEYAKDEINILAEFSGGNPRQAIRLLNYFNALKYMPNTNNFEMIKYAVKRTSSDFFSFSPKPLSELIGTIYRSKKIETSLFTLPGDKNTAARALYGNWIFLNGKNDEKSWNAIVNPIIKNSFSFDYSVEMPEIEMLKKYAEQAGISPYGLDFEKAKEIEEDKSKEKILQYFASNLETPIHTNLTEILDILAASLLSKNRSDRVIIAYKDLNILEAARLYMFAKANSYEYQLCKHKNIEGGENKDSVREFNEFLSESADIYSIQFDGIWTESQIKELDKIRDRLLNYQLIWWISIDILNKYIPRWINLRQLFEIFVLEDELLRSLSIEEIRSDISFFENLEKSKNVNEYIVNLRKVLEYLEKVKDKT